MPSNGSRKRGDSRAQTRAAILGAVLEWAAESGLGRVSMDAIARRARLARATLYQHFPGRDALVQAAIRSELDRFYVEVDKFAGRISGHTERMAASFGFVYAYLLSHRILVRAMAVNPQVLIPHILGDSPTLAEGRAFFHREIRKGDYRADCDLEALADFVVRQLHSVVLSPLPGSKGASTEELVAIGRHYAEEFVVPIQRRYLKGDAQ
ncbi:TetR/AcrR family transcriptional regulator [Tsukamurella sp. 8F]|uniref:TetR/AcrR family transcriptional regulator n=1 Tax=unclassified Tsukamurella TaxID=2633480 RepID=UPI0023B8F542|nr:MULTISPECIES: TetR/AcrR family transcriptional regulator [unclassified Tsukamurella]MDF0529028.1 TetR/AcrR family transcriptional regulator [Tsukamurella sp. 8J]MDF0587401.1 TetR/AcrR family transcriptional regulator [Tsukamurella sp. 8F]